MKQQGFVIPLLLTLMLLGALAFSIDADRIGSTLGATRAIQSRASLAEVADALIGSAASYKDSHTAMPRYGPLPCPDLNANGWAGAATPGCGSGADFSLGTVPYRTLGLTPPEDGSGNCIWYAVASGFKNLPVPAIFNWDSTGQFEIADPTGTLILDGSNAHQRAVAVLIAPALPLPGQSRPARSAACRGGETEDDVAAFLESPGTAPADQLQRFTQGAHGSTQNNDQIAWITADDIIRRLMRSAYFQQFLNDQLDRAAALLTPIEAPLPVGSTMGNIDFGPLPDTGSYDPSFYASPPWAEMLSGNNKIQYDDWRPMFRYFRCNDDSQCLVVGSSPCRVVIAFAGARDATQMRDTAAAQGDAANYFEAGNLTAVSVPTNPFAGADTIDFDEPWKDVFKCIA